MNNAAAAHDFDPTTALTALVAFLRGAGIQVADSGTVFYPGRRTHVRVYARHDGTVALVEQVHSMPASRRIIKPRKGASARLRLLGELLAMGAWGTC